MSIVALEYLKDWMRQTHDEDDALLQGMLDGAEAEALKYLGLKTLPRAGDACPTCEPVSGIEPVSDADDVAPGVRNGICALVQASYEGGTADEIERMREVAFGMLRPYRCDWGV